MNQREITKNPGQNEVYSDPDLILYHSSVLIDKEPENQDVLSLIQLFRTTISISRTSYTTTISIRIILG